MKTQIFLPAFALAALLLAGCQESRTLEKPAQNDTKSTTDPEVSEHARDRIMAAKDALFARLSSRLTAVINSDGPAAAIEVCRSEAPVLAKEVGTTQGVTIGRTSFKLRNPENSAPDWAKKFVEERVTEPQFVALPEGVSGGLVPILLKEKCLICHGPKDTIAADIRAKLDEHYPSDQATGFKQGDLRGWFWVEVPAQGTSHSPDPQTSSDSDSNAVEQVADKHVDSPADGHGPGHRRGRGFGRGMGRGPGMQADMSTLHAMFADRAKINRTVKLLPDGAEATTESDDDNIAAMIQEHVPAMESRVHDDNPLPPMTFHPIFVGLIKHAKDYTLDYKLTDKGIKVTYQAEDPYVIMLVQEHAQLVSRFIKNGMEEIHKPYQLPEVGKSKDTSNDGPQ